jgi:hypothetical protein
MNANAWHAYRPANKMTERIRTLAEELQTVQQELCAELAFPDGTPRKHPLGVQACGKGDLVLLREAIDQFRRVLWFYVDQIETEKELDERKPPASAKYGRNGSQLPVEQRPASPQVMQQPISFFDRLDLVIEGYFQTGGQLRPGKPRPD